MKILITHSIDLFKIYFNNWLERKQLNNEVSVITDENNEQVIMINGMPSTDDILSYINSFISCQKKSKQNIFKYYFVIDSATKLAKTIRTGFVKFGVNIRKLYARFVKAIQKRISNQIFYIDDVESINDDVKSILNIFSNIGKSNVIIFGEEEIKPAPVVA